MIVADTNLIAYLFLNGEFTTQAESIYKQDSDWVAPYLWRSEFRNILTLYQRKKILTLAQSQAIARGAAELFLGKEFELESKEILELAANCNLSAYIYKQSLIFSKKKPSQWAIPANQSYIEAIAALGA